MVRSPAGSCTCTSAPAATRAAGTGSAWVSSAVAPLIAAVRRNPTTVVPPARYTAPGAPPSPIASATPAGVTRSNGCIASRLPRLLDRRHDAVVGAAAAQIAAHPLPDLLAPSGVAFADQRQR